jgi:hypothetical protein
LRHGRGGSIGCLPHCAPPRSWLVRAGKSNRRDRGRSFPSDLVPGHRRTDRARHRNGPPSLPHRRVIRRRG